MYYVPKSDQYFVDGTLYFTFRIYDPERDVVFLIRDVSSNWYNNPFPILKVIAKELGVRGLYKYNKQDVIDILSDLIRFE